MDRSIGRLHEGRVQKIIHRLRREKAVIPEAFILANYKNTAAYGEFNTAAETNHIISLYEESKMNQAPKVAQTNVETLAAALAKAEADLVIAKREHIKATTGARYATEHLTSTEVQANVARNALGKAKLAEAIALVDKVGAEAPAGSEASKDIDSLAHRLMQRNVPFELIFAKPYGGNPPTSQTSAAIASMTTSVGAGQPRQAKPTPWIPKVGDKVRLVRAWYDGSKPYVGKVLTVDKLSCGTYLYFTEFQHGENCTVNYVEPAGDFRVGDEVIRNPAYTGFTACSDTGVLTVANLVTYHNEKYIQVAEHMESLPDHRYTAEAFKYA